MTIEISINNIIDTLTGEFDEIESFYSIFTNSGKRTYSPKNTRWTMYGNDYEKARERAYYNMEKARAKIYAAADVLGVKYDIIWQAVKIARNWYERTEWQRCLSEEDAAGLWACAVKNNKK